MPASASEPLISAAPPPSVAGEEGDRPAEDVSNLFREHNQTLVRFLNSRLGSEQEAKEIAQEAYVKLLQLERRGAISFMRAYLFRIAANLAIDRIRQRKSQGPHDDIDLFEELEDDAHPERTVMATEQLEHIVQYMEELPERCAEAFVLHRFHGLRPTEVASTMQISDRRVRMHLVRALMYCKLRMDGVGREEALSRTTE